MFYFIIESRQTVSGYGWSDLNPKDQNIPDINQKMIWMTILNTRGYHERIAGYIGERLIDCLKRNKVETVPG